MGFVTGGNSAGSDIGNGLGEFLLTRPYTRGHLVWVGWIVGLAEVITLTALTVVMALGVFSVAEGPVWRRLQPHALGTVPVILLLQIVLMACVVYGLTYCCTILLRNSTRGILISISVVVTYSAINGLMEHWLGESLPSVTFAVQQLGAVSWYQNSIVRLVGWAVIALLFPVLADVALGRADL
jgi:ABC-type transport system involved in multi-copper enzyme maturation permease subunit